MPKMLPLLATVLVLAFVAGCAKPSNNIQLTYQPTGAAIRNCNNKQIALVRFADSRKRTEIGDKDREMYFYPGDRSVTEWVTRAIADELTDAGCQVQYHDTLYPFNVDYTITGEVETVYLHQSGMLDNDADLKIKIKVMKGNDVVVEKDYSSSTQKKSFSTSSSSRENILISMLQDVLREAIPDIMSKMQ